MFSVSQLLVLQFCSVLNLIACLPPPDVPPTADPPKVADKFDELLDAVKTLWKNTGDDVIIIASQNVHDDDGSIKEIRTIELVLPKQIESCRPHNDNFYLEQLKNDDDDFSDILVKMQAGFKEQIENNNLTMQAAYKQLSEAGDIKLELYVNKDEAFYQGEDGIGYHIMDNIERDSKQQLLEEVKTKLQDKEAIVSILVWDKDDKFVSNESTVDARILAYANKASEEMEEEVLDAALQTLTDSALNSPFGIAKRISLGMSKRYPDYTWFVIEGNEVILDNARKDGFVTMTFDSLKVGDPYLQYTLYGIQKINETVIEAVPI